MYSSAVGPALGVFLHRLIEKYDFAETELLINDTIYI
jgi:hypothetical protein